MGLSSRRITAIISEENRILNNIIAENKVNVVISDNRFGLYNRNIHSVFVTHQLFLKAPVFEGLGNTINRKYISNFNEIWVPDFENEKESLSGELSHGALFHKHVKYIGAQSRLADVITNIEAEKYDYLVLLSGPEPSRAILEKMLLEKIRISEKRFALVRGTDSVFSNTEKNLSVFDFPKKEELKKLILSSRKIICRSGYSTLMDMHLLNKKELILIPTPGQTEQEYLADYWKSKFNTMHLPQNKINNFTL